MLANDSKISFLFGPGHNVPISTLIHFTLIDIKYEYFFGLVDLKFSHSMQTIIVTLLLSSKVLVANKYSVKIPIAIANP